MAQRIRKELNGACGLYYYYLSTSFSFLSLLQGEHKMYKKDEQIHGFITQIEFIIDINYLGRINTPFPRNLLQDVLISFCPRSLAGALSCH